MPKKGANFGVSSASDILTLVYDNSRIDWSLDAIAEARLKIDDGRVVARRTLMSRRGGSGDRP